MSETRSLTKHFEIKSPIMGVPRSAYQSGTLETRDKALIAMLRRLPDYKAKEIVEQEPQSDDNAMKGLLYYVNDERKKLADLTWHEIQKLGSEKGVLKSGMGREEIEQAIRNWHEKSSGNLT